jgi:hypothetical protein
MVLEENTGLQAAINPPNNKSNPKNSRLAKTTFILGLIGIIILILSFITPALIYSSLKVSGSYFIIIAIVGIAALLGLMLALVSVIIGIIALVMIRKSKGMLRGKGWAISGLIMGLLPLLLLGALIVYGMFMVSSQAKYSAAKAFNPTEYKGETGTIILPYKGESALTLRGEKESIRLSATDGTLKAPTGDYHVSSYEASGKDERNVKWTASTYSYKTKISVRGGSSEELAIGPPFIASIDVKTGSGDQITLNFNLKDKEGNSYSISNSEPSFQVISQSGDVLWQGKFQFG